MCPCGPQTACAIYGKTQYAACVRPDADTIRGPPALARRHGRAAPPSSPPRHHPAARFPKPLWWPSFPRLIPPGKIDVLEVGCGSGRAREILARAGYHGTYTGVDVFDRFDREPETPFESSFELMDAHDLEPGARFDLIFSNSALEHIPDDAQLIAHLRTTLRPGGIQLHIIPSGAALYAYLWHGYRQYARGAVAKRFKSATPLFSHWAACSAFCCT